jgi:hypothetical protein
MNVKDIRVRKVVTKQRKTFFWKKYTKTIWVSNIVEVKYNDDWVKLNVFIDEKFI